MLRRELDTRNQGILACDLVYAVENPVEQDGRVYPGAWHDGDYIADAYLHPTKVLPHCLKGDLDDLFPKATAAPELEELQEEKDPMEERGMEIGKSNGERVAPGSCRPRTGRARDARKSS